MFAGVLYQNSTGQKQQKETHGRKLNASVIVTHVGFGSGGAAEREDGGACKCRPWTWGVESGRCLRCWRLPRKAPRLPAACRPCPGGRAPLSPAQHLGGSIAFHEANLVIRPQTVLSFRILGSPAVALKVSGICSFVGSSECVQEDFCTLWYILFFLKIKLTFIYENVGHSSLWYHGLGFF